MNDRDHTDIDFLIVGQGLAGSLLAWELLHRGQRVLVVDNGHRTASSTAAAGLLNPVTGKRLVKTTRVDECLPVARACYQAIATSLGGPLLHDLPMLRVFRNQGEREAWQKRGAEPPYEAYLNGISEALDPYLLPQGGGLQRQTGYLDTTRLLSDIRDYLLQTGRYRQTVFEYGAIDVEEGRVRWDGMSSRYLIFCEGYRTRLNPWFDWLPFQPAKGEILSLLIQEPLPEVILNAGKWLMPRGDGRYRLGATYEREQLDERPTEEGRRELLEALGAMFYEIPRFEVTNHQAGVRPNTRDKQPFLGLHPEHSALGVFNGFGSKGSLLIPWHARCFADFILEGKTLPEDVNIQRCWGRT